MIDYKVKIQKLLALSESPNEFEAKAALLKARELMALHKIGKIDLIDVSERKVVRVDSGYSYSRRGDFWIGTLAVIIAKNYCCKPITVKDHSGAQMRHLQFVGFVDDVNMCKEVFDYAVKSARELGKIYARENGNGLSKAKVIKSYAYGFALGVDEAFDSQDESDWGLVMVIPKEVDDYMEKIGATNDRYRSRQTIYNSCKASGYEQGKQFRPIKKVEG